MTVGRPPTARRWVEGKLRAALVEPFSHQLPRFLEAEVIGSCDSLLDVGCGYDSPARDLCRRLGYSVGVDAFEPYLERSRASGIHHEYRCADVMEIEEQFGRDSFDCVLALDLIEHLEKSAGEALLAAMERVARRKVIVFTPNGFLEQRSYHGNGLQEHRSGWTPQEMRDRGYRVYGIHGWQRLRGERGRARWRPAWMWELLALWTHPWFVNRPERAFQILCIKEIGRPAVTAAPDRVTALS